LNTEQWKVN